MSEEIRTEDVDSATDACGPQMSTESSARDWISSIDRRSRKKQKLLQIDLNVDPTEDRTNVDDRLSDLPPEIVDLILVKLPIREAIRTSILSRDWRHRCKYLSQLCFCDSHCLTPSYTEAITHFLKNHEGQLDKLYLSVKFPMFPTYPLDFPRNCTYFDEWMELVSTKVVKNMIVHNHHHVSSGALVLPPSFFSFRHLVHLQMFSCDIKLPDSFQGFKLLKSLCLRYVGISEDHFYMFISRCTNLEKLVLERFFRKDFHENKNLRICGRNLKTLELVYSMHERIIFENCPCITSIAVKSHLYPAGWFSDSNYWDVDLPDIYVDATEVDTPDNLAVTDQEIVQLLKETTSILFKALGSCFALQRLSLPAKIFEFLDMGLIERLIPIACHHLKTIHLFNINFKDQNSVQAFHSILTHSPDLEQLNFSVRYDTTSISSNKLLKELRKHRLYSFEKLRSIKVKYDCIYEVNTAVAILNLIVGSASALEKVTFRKEKYPLKSMPEKTIQMIATNLKRICSSRHVTFRYEFGGPPEFSSTL